MSQLLTPRFRVEVSRHRTMNVSRAPFTADNAVINYFQSLTISTTNTQLSPIVIKHSEISNWASTHLKTINDSHFHDRSTGRRTVVWPFNSFLSHVWKQQDLACFPLINFIFFCRLWHATHIKLSSRSHEGSNGRHRQSNVTSLPQFPKWLSLMLSPQSH